MGYIVGGILWVIGLILVFAVNDSVSGVDLSMLGYILVGVGLIVMIVTLYTGLSRRSKAVDSSHTP